MDFPGPTMIRDLCSDRDHTLDEACYSPFHSFTRSLQLPQRIQNSTPSYIPGDKWLKSVSGAFASIFIFRRV
jgi:hypothetical protein